jgi:hypothetical protein
MNEGPATPRPITYAEWLARQIQGAPFICKVPVPIVDLPALWERMFPVLRPNHALEARLKARLREAERQAEI